MQTIIHHKLGCQKLPKDPPVNRYIHPSVTV